MAGARGDDGEATGLRVVPSRLALAVRHGVELLGDLRALHPDVDSGALERALRHEISRLLAPGGPADHPSIAAVRSACAYLGVAAYEEAHLALLTAENLLPRLDAGGSPGATP